MFSFLETKKPFFEEAPNNHGFTLIELLIVVAIIGVGASLAMIGADFIKKNKLNAASRELLADLQRIRKDAITKSTSTNSRGFGIRFLSGTSFRTFEFIDVAGGGNEFFQYDGSAEEANPLVKNLPSPITVKISDSHDPVGNDDEDLLLYDKRGLTRKKNWSSAGAGKTFVLRHPGISQARCVVVSQVRIREGTWSGTSCTAR